MTLMMKQLMNRRSHLVARGRYPRNPTTPVDVGCPTSQNAQHFCFSVHPPDANPLKTRAAPVVGLQMDVALQNVVSSLGDHSPEAGEPLRSWKEPRLILHCCLFVGQMGFS